jgi:hypothetical protein
MFQSGPYALPRPVVSFKEFLFVAKVATDHPQEDVEKVAIILWKI